MSSSGSSNAFPMMESVALNESHVVVEDIDYVLVEPQNKNDMQMDDDSYDYCEDVVSMLSVEQPLSVCSDLPSIDPTCFGIDTKEEAKPERRPRVISFGNDEDELCTRTGKFQSSVEPLDEHMSEVEEDSESAVTSIAEATEEMIAEPEPMEEKVSDDEERIEAIAAEAMVDMKPTVSTSRLSNKKRRKKMKLMKRAAAAAAAAAALSEMTAYQPTAPTLPPPSPKKSRKSKSTTRSKKVLTNVAVTCATETMEAYRQELANKKNGSSKFIAPL